MIAFPKRPEPCDVAPELCTVSEPEPCPYCEPWTCQPTEWTVTIGPLLPGTECSQAFTPRLPADEA